MYDYRRMLPHYQKAGRALFVTFCKLIPTPFTAAARDAILRHCRNDDGKRYQLHAAVVMPDHVHLLLTPVADETGWIFGLPAISKAIKGASARSVNKLLGCKGPVWQEESFDHVSSLAREAGGKVRVHPSKSSQERFSEEARRLPLAVGRARPKMRQGPCGSDTLVRRP